MSDNNNNRGDRNLIGAFNDFINDNDLRELYRGGDKYTWTNKQANPIRSNIDRVLMSTNWEQKFPLVHLTSLTRLDS